MKRHTKYKPTGWRGEPHRHYLAAKGIKTKRYNSPKEYFAYQATYTGGDLPLIAGDAVGTAGAATVALIPLAVTAGVLYVGVRGLKRSSEGKSFFSVKADQQAIEVIMSEYEEQNGFPMPEVEITKLNNQVASLESNGLEVIFVGEDSFDAKKVMLDTENSMLTANKLVDVDDKNLFAKKQRLKTSAPKFKQAVKTSLHPKELIIPSSKQEQEWAEGLYSLITGKEPKNE